MAATIRPSASLTAPSWKFSVFGPGLRNEVTSKGLMSHRLPLSTPPVDLGVELPWKMPPLESGEPLMSSVPSSSAPKFCLSETCRLIAAVPDV